MQFFIHLDDYTDRGTPWPFYEQAEIIDYADASGPIEALRPELQFRKFQGIIDSVSSVHTYLLYITPFLPVSLYHLAK